jgi:hypothetical protein
MVRSPLPPAEKRRARRSEVETGRLRVHDPFDLVRWLALSQPDPRKALAELVQNSLDANARTIRVIRRRDKGRTSLVLWDDGDGVIPEIDRPEALRYIATHVGHSRKRSLSPQERLQLMTQGQYGIGLLGFWSLGERLEMRTSVPGQRPHRLVLFRDRADYQIEPLRGRLPLPERWTEIVVLDLKPDALSALVGRRAADYLGAELRGQLLAREVQLVVEDRIARGTAAKTIHVRPRRFLGERVSALSHLEIPGQPNVQLELYLLGTSSETTTESGVAVYAAGTQVADSFRDLGALGLDHSPWTDERLTGFVDSPALRVAPGSRRGIIPDEAAHLFAMALHGTEPILTALLDSYERRRARELDQEVVKDLRRAFRDFFRRSPRYEALPVSQPNEETTTTAAPTSPSRDNSPELPELDSPPAHPELFPPGPLATVKILPSRLRIECAGERRVRAMASDAEGRHLDTLLVFAWQLSPGLGQLVTTDDAAASVAFQAADRPAKGTLLVVCRSGSIEARAEASINVVEAIGQRDQHGVPDPELVDLPAASWRSRMCEGRWQVNAAHPDGRAIANRPALRLRYLALLFAKEIVLRNSGDPRIEGALEQLVEVAAYADRELATSRLGRRKTVPNGDRVQEDPELAPSAGSETRGQSG